MSDDQTRPIGSDAPLPPPPARPQDTVAAPEPPAAQEAPAQPAYAMPVPAGHLAGYSPYAAAQRPRFVDQVLGMRAVVAVAIACLLIGGLSGFVLGRATADDGDRFGGPGGGFFQQRGGTFPDGGNGAPNQQFGPGPGGG